ncbi:MAG: hypothetical protein WBF26_03060, partial [Candidatus Sulfotelmatobacter sp.]
GQERPMTAEQVISKYLEAIGGSENISSITTFSEKGEGNSIGVGPHSTGTQHWTFESYFKAPNLRTSLTFNEKGVVGISGCDGKMAWYIDRTGRRQEFKPKPGKEYECMNGLGLLPLVIRPSNLKVQLKGQKKVDDRLAWEVKTENPGSAWPSEFYFDAETYLLLRSRSWRSMGRGGLSVEQTYSDYRVVGSIKLPFVIVARTEGSTSTTTIREVQVNAPIDDARFEEPAVGGKPATAHTQAESPAKPVTPEKAETPVIADAPEPHAAPQPAPEVTYVNSTSFVTSSVAELQGAVPELRGLKAAQDQQDLLGLLDKVGAKTVDLGRKIPNLICNEEVLDTRPGAKAAPQEYSYLILAHRGPQGVTLVEFRVDLKSGAKLQSGDTGNPGAPADSPSGLDELAHTSDQVSARKSGAPPLGQGFTSMWVRFYPSNRSESTFRYLGQQQIDQHQTFVLAFAEKPGAVRMPGEVRVRGKSVAVYYQGIAWVDASDFRIVRLRTDLLAPLFDLSLTRLTAEVEFASTQAAGFDSPLWLPREVMVTSQFGGRMFLDKHSYSKYRSFQAHAKILLDR